MPPTGRLGIGRRLPTLMLSHSSPAPSRISRFARRLNRSSSWRSHELNLSFRRDSLAHLEVRVPGADPGGGRGLEELDRTLTDLGVHHVASRAGSPACRRCRSRRTQARTRRRLREAQACALSVLDRRVLGQRRDKRPNPRAELSITSLTVKPESSTTSCRRPAAHTASP